jgi:hypothetical protein
LGAYIIRSRKAMASQNTKGARDMKSNTREKRHDRSYHEWEVDEMIADASRQRYKAYLFGAASTFLIMSVKLGLVVPLLRGLLHLMTAN